MSLNPPPVKIPDSFKEDIEVQRFMDDLLKSVYLMWAGFEKNVGFYGTDPVVQASALTGQLTTVTHTAPGIPDYVIQDLTTTTPFGFVTKDEGNTVLSVIVNLQARVSELEATLDSSTGIGIIN